MGRKNFRRCAAVLLIFGCLFSARSVIGATDERAYFCEIKDTDGVLKIQTMRNGDITAARKAQKDEYRKELKDWTDARKEWAKAAGARPYPVPRPVSARIKKLSRVPVTRTKYDKAFERYQDKLEVWNVCIMKSTDGMRIAKAIRRDKMHLEKTKLLTEYAEQAVEYLTERKEDPEGTKDNKPPKKPLVSIFRSGLRKADLADKLAEKLTAKLAEKAEKADGGQENEGEGNDE
jgi:hypothetical protein